MGSAGVRAPEPAQCCRQPAVLLLLAADLVPAPAQPSAVPQPVRLHPSSQLVPTLLDPDPDNLLPPGHISDISGLGHPDAVDAHLLPIHHDADRRQCDND